MCARLADSDRRCPAKIWPPYVSFIVHIDVDHKPDMEVGSISEAQNPVQAKRNQKTPFGAAESLKRPKLLSEQLRYDEETPLDAR